MCYCGSMRELRRVHRQGQGQELHAGNPSSLAPQPHKDHAQSVQSLRRGAGHAQLHHAGLGEGQIKWRALRAVESLVVPYIADQRLAVSLRHRFGSVIEWHGSMRRTRGHRQCAAQ